MPSWVEQSLGLGGVPDKPIVKRTGLAAKKCSGCGLPVVILPLQGTSSLDSKKGWAVGVKLKCETEPTADGQFYVVLGKTFHRRRPEDDRGLFFREHRCSGFD